MHPEAMADLRDPIGNGPLQLEAFSEAADGHILEGVLHGAEGCWYPITDGVPCFLTGLLRPDLQGFARRHGLRDWQSAELASRAAEQQSQRKTNETFSDKWRRFKNYGFESAHRDLLFDFYRRRLALPDRAALETFYGRYPAILEAGPGSGFNTRFMAERCPGRVYAIDVSDAAFTAFENTRDLTNCFVVQADLMQAPFGDAAFDFIIADGVLHHTPDTRAAFLALYRKLASGGDFFFYVYRKMGAARQFSDHHIREHFTQMSPEECYATCEAITELGRELSRLNAQITLEKPIPVLGIPAGEHDVQRLLYYNFLKCYWNEAFDYETNNMVNFDWYHPHDAWQHDQDEVTAWLEEVGVGSYRFNDANPNGISVLLSKP